MLPGLRFLFVAIVMSLSMMIFGLGAAALLRSAHQEFANLPTRHVQPEAVFAQQPEASGPTLALLRVDPPRTERPGIERPVVADVPPPPPPQEPPSTMVSIEPERVAAEPDKSALPSAALPSEEKSVTSYSSPEAPAQAETTARVELGAPPPENHELESQKHETQTAVSPAPATSAAVETTTAAVETTAVAAAPEPTNAPTSDSAKAAAAKIATLGGGAVTIEPQAASKVAVRTPVKRGQVKRVEARHPVKRRRIARARMIPQKPAEQPAAATPLFATARPGG